MSSYSSNTASYRDVIKGFRRLGQFPLDADSVFDSYDKALEYAVNGATGKSNAYPGQLVSIIPEDVLDNVSDVTAQSNFFNPGEVYIVSPDYSLAKLPNKIALDGSLTYELDSSEESMDFASGSTIIYIPTGYVVTSVSINVKTAFASGYYIDLFLKKLSDVSSIDNDDESWIDNIPLDDSGIINIQTYFKAADSAYRVLLRTSSNDQTIGDAIIKLN